jgi:hypothetical protein
MRGLHTRRLALALALFTCALAAPAEAKNVVGARVNPNPEAVRAYWTPERMRTAIPRDVVRGGGPANKAKPGGAGGGGGSTTGAAALVTWPSTLDLTYTNGKVYFTDNGVRYVCSGTAVNSTNGSVVWTAGHCANDGGSNRFYTDWIFKPAYNSGTTFPIFTATHLYTSSEWANNQEYGKDFAAAVVGPQSNKTLEQTLGLGRDLGFNLSAVNGDARDAYGYPAAGKFNGEKLYHCASSITYIDTSGSPATTGIPCSMTGGSSGGAWLNSGGLQVSNTSYGYNSLKNVLFGPVFGNVAADMLHAAETTGTAGTVVNN